MISRRDFHKDRREGSVSIIFMENELASVNHLFMFFHKRLWLGVNLSVNYFFYNVSKITLIILSIFPCDSLLSDSKVAYLIFNFFFFVFVIKLIISINDTCIRGQIKKIILLRERHWSIVIKPVRELTRPRG